MKQLVTVRSNTYYEQNEGETPFSLKPLMELVIIHTNGKDYLVTKAGAIVGKPILEEIRLLVNPELLTSLITELQLHQRKFEVISKNADQLSTLVRHISKEAEL